MRIARVLLNGETHWASGTETLRIHPVSARLSDIFVSPASRPDDAQLLAGEARFLPPLDPSGRLFCVGRNFRDHALEVGGSLPARPSFFQRGHWSLVGHMAPLDMPAASHQYDFEGEMAVVLRRGGRQLDRESAAACIGGITLLMDGSVRDFQQDSLFAGKNFARSGSLGPWIVAVDAISPEFTIETLLNGSVVQQGRLQDLIFSVGELLSYLSAILELRPGDIISTGTPAGVGLGHTPPRWLKKGDRIEIRSPQIGSLVNRVG